MEPSLIRDDLSIFLEAVDRFARGSIASLVERHEVALSPLQVEQLSSEAGRLGLLNLGTEPGDGLWENLNEAAGVRLSTAALRRLAEENAGVAWHFHQLAFGRWLALRLGFDEAVGQGTVLASIQGGYGLGRAALPRYLRGAELSGEDQALLRDYFTPQPDGPSIILHQLEGWRWLLAPFFEEERIDWRLLPRESITCEEHPHSHGLDELTSVAIKPPLNFQARTHLGGEQSRSLYAEALQISALALMSVASGAVRKAYRIARDYAAIRWQGGTMINRLPAVQQMLSGILSAIQVSGSLIDDLSAHPPSLERTAKVLAVRSRIQAMLCQAASDAMQVMGGIGYMRDTGIEKVLRDTNQLRLMHGTPGELSLFVAEWERLQ